MDVLITYKYTLDLISFWCYNRICGRKVGWHSYLITAVTTSLFKYESIILRFFYT